MSDSPAPSRAPTTALPPEVTALIDALCDAEVEEAHAIAENRNASGKHSERRRAARARLDAALLQFVEDGRRLDWLEQRAKHGETVTLGWSRECGDWDERSNRSVTWPETFWLDDETDVDPPRASIRECIDAARSVVAAPVGEAEQP